MRFKVTILSEENIFFGDELSIDTTFLEGKAVLLVVGTANRFFTTPFTDSHRRRSEPSEEDVWLASKMVWCSVYIRYLNRLLTDQRSVFKSPCIIISCESSEWNSESRRSRPIKNCFWYHPSICNFKHRPSSSERAKRNLKISPDGIELHRCQTWSVWGRDKKSL